MRRCRRAGPGRPKVSIFLLSFHSSPWRLAFVKWLCCCLSPKTTPARTPGTRVCPLALSPRGPGRSCGSRRGGEGAQPESPPRRRTWPRVGRAHPGNGVQATAMSCLFYFCNGFFPFLVLKAMQAPSLKINTYKKTKKTVIAPPGENASYVLGCTDRTPRRAGSQEGTGLCSAVGSAHPGSARGPGESERSSDLCPASTLCSSAGPVHRLRPYGGLACTLSPSPDSVSAPPPRPQPPPSKPRYPLWARGRGGGLDLVQSRGQDGRTPSEDIDLCPQSVPVSPPGGQAPTRTPALPQARPPTGLFAPGGCAPCVWACMCDTEQR